MASIAHEGSVDAVLERRYLALVHIARSVTDAADWVRFAAAAGGGFDVALGAPGDAPAGVRLWAATADGLDELARHPADHPFPHVSRLELRRAAESTEPVAAADRGLLAALHVDGSVIGVVQIDHPSVDADLVADAAPLLAGRAGVLARRGTGGVLFAPLPAEESDASALMAAFATEARRELEHDRLSAYLLACEGRAFERFAVATSPAIGGEGVVIPFEELGLRHVVVTNRALVSADLATDPRIVGREDRVIARAGFHGLVSVPLRLHGRPIGVLNFVSRSRGFYCE
jgi:GAF domain-containing protein